MNADLEGEGGVTISLGEGLRLARFVERPNRFLVRCLLAQGEQGASDRPAASGGMVEAHLPDPGRLQELLQPGRRLWLRPAGQGQRKTRWTVILTESPARDSLVSVDTTLPNRLIAKALARQALAELAGWCLERREFRHGDSRFDFLLARADGRRMILEVKSVTLVVDGVGLFPDAVTARGRRHVQELAEIARRPGWQAGVLFVVQRRDGRRVRAAAELDPDFAAALARAREAGVMVFARRCVVCLTGVTLGGAVPVA